MDGVLCVVGCVARRCVDVLLDVLLDASLDVLLVCVLII